ncbi:MAG: hypothetical protein C4524_05085 [Candidatus Zixiibacteriota bacterium]|nr:MAG: hypothetical protein C4524_05085 [candidate division Zixibacteria bacterium]
MDQGAVPEALQWKKAAVLAVAVPQSPAWAEFLRQVEDGTDDVRTWVGEPQAGMAPRLYVIYGWSNSGADELRRVSLDSIQVRGETVDVYVTRPQVQLPNSIMGTADMKFIGWEAPLQGLDPGEYTARLMVRRPTLIISETGQRQMQEEVPYDPVKELQFRLPETP